MQEVSFIPLLNNGFLFYSFLLFIWSFADRQKKEEEKRLLDDPSNKIDKDKERKRKQVNALKVSWIFI